VIVEKGREGVSNPLNAKTAPEGAVSVFYRVSLKRSTHQPRLLNQVQQRLWVDAEEERDQGDGQ
jgi:hypothetical protein